MCTHLSTIVAAMTRAAAMLVQCFTHEALILKTFQRRTVCSFLGLVLAVYIPVCEIDDEMLRLENALRGGF